jgi:hypothetical protein
MCGIHGSKRLLRRTQASQFLKETWSVSVSPQTLAKLAVIGGGPPYRKCGPYPLYDPDDLNAWVLETKLGPKQRSTSEWACHPKR